MEKPNVLENNGRQAREERKLVTLNLLSKLEGPLGPFPPSELSRVSAEPIKTSPAQGDSSTASKTQTVKKTRGRKKKCSNSWAAF